MATSTRRPDSALQVRIKDAAQMAKLMEDISPERHEWHVCATQCVRDLKAALREVRSRLRLKL